MGTEPKTAAAAIAFARRMHGCGVQAVQVGPLDPGHSYLPSEAELRGFYLDVLGAIDGSAFLATHMSVGYDVPAGLLGELSEADHVRGIIATQLREYSYVPRLLQAVDGRTPVLLGSPVHLLEALVLGASGVVSSLDVNVAPHLYRALGTAWASQDLAAVSLAYETILRLFLRLLGEGGLLLDKAVLDRLGLAAGPPRPPRRPPDDAVMQRADAIIEAFALHL
jgi:4-hydroxy-tetrahydrodipicolinate synthase